MKKYFREIELINKMDDFKSRLLNEARSLEEKIIKLAEFTNSEKFSNLSSAQIDAMTRQLDLMRQYFSVLNERIELLK